jgi:DNA polymerase-4
MSHHKILHLDLDAFFCAVEELYDPTLRGKPFAVGGRAETRGVIASCSYAARQFGVRSAMPTSRALRLCPQLILLPSRHHTYGELSQRVIAILDDYTPLVEQISIDEAFLDLSDLPDDPGLLARRIQARIREELDLPCSIGAATNKLVAKIASDAGKSAVRTGQPPQAILVVPPGREEAFLAPLPVGRLWGVGPKMTARLDELGVKTIGDLAHWPAEDLARRFGKWGEAMSRHARGLDESPVNVEHEAKSISKEITFARDIADGGELRQTLRALAEGVGAQLRRHSLSGHTVKLKLRWPDFSTVTRQASLKQPTDSDGEIIAAAQQLFAQLWREGQAVRLIGVGVSGLAPTSHQLSLWDTNTERERRLLLTLDALRARFGDRIVRRGKA